MAQDDASKKAQKELAAAKGLYEKTKVAFSKAPKDAKKKKSYVDATVTYGNITMLSPVLGPKDKYPVALKLYREALKFDAKNPTALANKKTIEDIYTQMGRPIPK